MSSLSTFLVFSIQLRINHHHILHLHPYAKAVEAQFKVSSKSNACAGGNGVYHTLVCFKHFQEQTSVINEGQHFVLASEFLISVRGQEQCDRI